MCSALPVGSLLDRWHPRCALGGRSLESAPVQRPLTLRRCYQGIRATRDGLKGAERRALDQLLIVTLDQRRTAFQAIKRLPQRPSRKHLKEAVDHLEWLESLDSLGAELKDVAPALIQDFAHQARTADASDLKDFPSAKRYTLLLCLMHNARARARDTVAVAFGKAWKRRN